MSQHIVANFDTREYFVCMTEEEHRRILGNLCAYSAFAGDPFWDNQDDIRQVNSMADVVGMTSVPHAFTVQTFLVFNYDKREYFVCEGKDTQRAYLYNLFREKTNGPKGIAATQDLPFCWKTSHYIETNEIALHDLPVYIGEAGAESFTEVPKEYKQTRKTQIV